jgi:hypothetical protein
MSQITLINSEGIHVKHGDTVVVAPLPPRLDPDHLEDVELTEAEIATALAYEPPVIIDIDSLRAQLWQSFDRYAREQTDDNSRVSINLIAVNPDSTPQQRQRAVEWAGWWQQLWYVYAVKRATLLATSTMPTTDFAAEVGAAPWTIWEIAE